MAAKNCNIICWNVRGLNDGAKRASVRNQILSIGATLVCLQETNITNWNQTLLTETVGPSMVYNAAHLPSIGASGGILIAASDQFFKVQQTNLTTNIVTATITMLAENISWSITGVYGPQTDADKVAFMQEILALRQQVLPAWPCWGILT